MWNSELTRWNMSESKGWIYKCLLHFFVHSIEIFIGTKSMEIALDSENMEQSLVETSKNLRIDNIVRKRTTFHIPPYRNFCLSGEVHCGWIIHHNTWNSNFKPLKTLKQSPICGPQEVYMKWVYNSLNACWTWRVSYYCKWFRREVISANGKIWAEKSGFCH